MLHGDQSWHPSYLTSAHTTSFKQLPKSFTCADGMTILHFAKNQHQRSLKDTIRLLQGIKGVTQPGVGNSILLSPKLEAEG